MSKTFSIGHLTYQTIDDSRCRVTGCETDCKAVVIPAQVEREQHAYAVCQVDGRAFNRCCSLEAIEAEAGSDHFSHCDGVLYDKAFTTLVRCPVENALRLPLPHPVRRIAAYAFWGCQSVNMRYLALPHGVEEIGDYAFCSPVVQSIVLPEGVRRLGDHAFDHAGNLMEIALPDSLEETRPEAFALNGGLPAECRIVLSPHHPTLRYVDGALVTHGGDLVAVTEAMTIPTDATYQIAIPEGVKRIPAGALRNCSWLQQLILPQSLAYIDSMAFADLYGCERIAIRRKITSAKPISGDEEMAEIEACAIRDHEENEHFATQHGVLYDKRMTTLLFCPPLRGSDLIVPEGVERIADTAFYVDGEMSNTVRNVFLPSTMKEISHATFAHCRLEDIFISAHNPRYSASDGCIYNKDGSVFIDCTDSRWRHPLTLPPTLRHLDIYPYLCEDITLLATTPPTVGENPYNATGCTLHVPRLSMATYEKSEWRNIAKHIVAITEA